MITPIQNRILPENAQLIPDYAKCVFEGKIFDVYQWQQKMFDGSYQTFEMLRRPDTVKVIGLDEEGRIITLTEKQPGGSRARRHYLPGGRVDDGDASILDAAKREYREETGISFGDWRLIDVSQHVSKIEWFVYVYFAQDILQRTEPQHDVGEEISIGTSTFDDLKECGAENLSFLNGFSSVDELSALAEKYEKRNY